MKILTEREEILKRLKGIPIEYAVSNQNCRIYELKNGDIVKFYYNYLKPKNFLYGQVCYDIILKEYYINFEKFIDINHSVECNPIYFNLLKYEFTSMNKKLITSIKIEKSLKFVEKYKKYFKEYLEDNQYEKCLNLLKKNKYDEFDKEIIEMHKKGLIDFLLTEIEDEYLNIKDPTLKIDISIKCKGKAIDLYFSYIDLPVICDKIQEYLLNHCTPMIYITDSYLTFDIANDKTVVAYIHYLPKPKHQLNIIIVIKDRIVFGSLKEKENDCNENID